MSWKPMQFNKSKLALYKLSIYFNSWLYVSNKMERFSYKDGVVYLGVVYVSKFLKEELHNLGYR